MLLSCIISISAIAQKELLPSLPIPGRYQKSTLLHTSNYTPNFIINNTTNVYTNSIQPIAPNLFTQHFGFFCKQELKLEQCIHTPVIFRIGSIEHNNYLEQKTSYIYPVQ